MEAFPYKQGALHCEDVPVQAIADAVGTPFYLYSAAKLRDQIRRFDRAFAPIDHTVCFAVKANGNLAVINLFAQEGAGADIVSGGELFRAVKAGVQPKNIVYSGVGKNEREITEALAAGIRMFNVESAQELYELNRVAIAKGTRAPVALRVNPNVDPKTHPKISTGLNKAKFGIAIGDVVKYYREAAQMEGIEVVGIDCHIGSQLTQLSPFVDAVRLLKPLLDTLRADGMNIRYLDVGGGLGVVYHDETPPSPEAYARAILDVVGDWGVHLILEPGRFLTANAGIFVTKVLYLKEEHRNFVIVDAAMNDLIRPALYDSYMEVVPVQRAERPTFTAQVVGTICETGDVFAKDREIARPEPGELLAITGAGAYGFVMASNYNARPFVPEVMVDGGRFHVVRERGTYEDLIRGERMPPKG
ncbi:MAG: diaminopimelate decarboxylase [Myxococcales bacterium]|nr:diaminopimelate decarboxylase [Myxococcales bacterium]